MKIDKATPGPWHAQRLRDNDGAPYATQYQAHIDIGVCMVWAPLGNEEQEANARLIAAAPELLEALTAAMAFIESHVADWDITAEMAANYSALMGTNPRAAIAKATGEAP